MIARTAIEAANRIFKALEENDGGVPWNSELRKKDATALLFIALAQTRLLGISDEELVLRMEKLANEGGP